MNHFMPRDLLEGTFLPQIEVHKLASNGHYEASACGLKATHHDQSVAVNLLNEKIHNAMLEGTITPDS